MTYHLGNRVILADWGTTRLRMHLCDSADPSEARRLATVSGPGVKFAGDFAQTFLKLAGRLPAHDRPLNAVITGMIGSNIGWRESTYMSCPFDWSVYAKSGARFDLDGYRITILPGASCVNEFGWRDIMRGEEVQVLGALEHDKVGHGRQLFCLPGTHTKWVLVEDHSLKAFATSMPGELFDVLRRHSVLLRPGNRAAAAAGPMGAAFDDAVALLCDNAGLALGEALFSVRCRQVGGELRPDDALAWLSGLLVAADVRDVGARLRRRHRLEGPVTIVGDAALGALYARAFRAAGWPARVLDGEACTLAGLHACQQLLAPALA